MDQFGQAAGVGGQRAYRSIGCAASATGANWRPGTGRGIGLVSHFFVDVICFMRCVLFLIGVPFAFSFLRLGRSGVTLELLDARPVCN